MEQEKLRNVDKIKAGMFEEVDELRDSLEAKHVSIDLS